MAKIKSAPRHRGHDHPFKPRSVSTHAFKQVYWPYLPVVVAIGVLLSLGFKSGSLNTAIAHPSGNVLSYATSMPLKSLLDDTNKERSLSHIASLQINSKLSQAAQSKAEDMAIRNYWSRETPDGQQPWTFVA